MFFALVVFGYILVTYSLFLSTINSSYRESCPAKEPKCVTAIDPNVLSAEDVTCDSFERVTVQPVRWLEAESCLSRSVIFSPTSTSSCRSPGGLAHPPHRSPAFTDSNHETIV